MSIAVQPIPVCLARLVLALQACQIGWERINDEEMFSLNSNNKHNVFVKWLMKPAGFLALRKRGAEVSRIGMKSAHWQTIKVFFYLESLTSSDTWNWLTRDSLDRLQSGDVTSGTIPPLWIYIWIFCSPSFYCNWVELCKCFTALPKWFPSLIILNCEDALELVSVKL
jgi:hypothetical protein